MIKQVRHGWISPMSAAKLEELLNEASDALLTSLSPNASKLRKRIWGMRQHLNNLHLEEMPEGETEGLTCEV